MTKSIKPEWDNYAMHKLQKIKWLVDEDFSDLLAASSSSTAFWDNEADKVWDNS